MIYFWPEIHPTTLNSSSFTYGHGWDRLKAQINAEYTRQMDCERKICVKQRWSRCFVVCCSSLSSAVPYHLCWQAVALWQIILTLFYKMSCLRGMGPKRCPSSNSSLVGATVWQTSIIPVDLSGVVCMGSSDITDDLFVFALEYKTPVLDQHDRYV